MEPPRTTWGPSRKPRLASFEGFAKGGAWRWSQRDLRQRATGVIVLRMARPPTITRPHKGGGNGRRADSLRGQAAVDDDLRAGGEGGFVAGEVEDLGGDLLRAAQTAKRRRAREALARPLGILRTRDEFLNHRRLRERGGHRIHPNLVAAASPVERGGFRQQPDRALARAIGDRLRVADNAGDGGKIDDRAAARVLPHPHRLAAAQEHSLDIDP